MTKPKPSADPCPLCRQAHYIISLALRARAAQRAELDAERRAPGVVAMRQARLDAATAAAKLDDALDKFEPPEGQ